MIQWDMSLRCDDAKYSTKAIFSTSWKIWQLWNFLHWEKFPIFSQCQVFTTVKNFPTHEVSTLSKLRTSMQSWLRTTAATEWFAGYLINTQSQLICIIIAQPHPEPACNDDTCQPHNTLDMLFNLSFKLVLIEASDIRLRRTSWWQQARQFDIVGSEQRSVADQWQDRIV